VTILVAPAVVCLLGLAVYLWGPPRAQAPALSAWGVGLLVVLLFGGGDIWNP
jgi:hypothetical protein